MPLRMQCERQNGWVIGKIARGSFNRMVSTSFAMPTGVETGEKIVSSNFSMYVPEPASRVTPCWGHWSIVVVIARHSGQKYRGNLVIKV